MKLLIIIFLYEDNIRYGLCAAQIPTYAQYTCRGCVTLSLSEEKLPPKLIQEGGAGVGGAGVGERELGSGSRSMQVVT